MRHKPRLPIAWIALLFTPLFSACDKDCRATGDPGSCICIALYAPVCGCDGETYENNCRAECAGITDYRDGACQ